MNTQDDIFKPNNIRINKTILNRLQEKVESGEFATIHEAADLIIFQGLLFLETHKHE